MHVKALIPLLICLAAGCSGNEADKENIASKVEVPGNGRSVTESLPKGAKPSSEVLELRKISGVWRSAPGVLADAPGQILQMEFAFDKSFSMTLWGKDPKSSGEAVFARKSGKFVMTEGGITGSSSDTKPSVLKAVGSWTAKNIQSGSMTLSGPSGSPVINLLKKSN